MIKIHKIILWLCTVFIGVSMGSGIFVTEAHEAVFEFSDVVRIHHLIPEVKIWGHDVSEQSKWKPHYAGANQTFQLRKDQKDGPDASHEIDIFIAYYKYQAKGTEMVRFGNNVAQNDIWIRTENKTITTKVSGRPQPVNEVLLQSANGKRLVLFWYWVDGVITANSYKAKFFDAKAKLMGGRLDSAIIAISLPVDRDTFEQQKKILSNFAASLPPLETIVFKSE